MSVAILVQGCTGISCPRDVLGFCLCLDCKDFKHNLLLALDCLVIWCTCSFSSLVPSLVISLGTIPHWLDTDASCFDMYVVIGACYELVFGSHTLFMDSVHTVESGFDTWTFIWHLVSTGWSALLVIRLTLGGR